MDYFLNNLPLVAPQFYPFMASFGALIRYCMLNYIFFWCFVPKKQTETLFLIDFYRGQNKTNKNVLAQIYLYLSLLYTHLSAADYFLFLLSTLVLLSNFLCLFFLIFFFRFLTTLPKISPPPFLTEEIIIHKGQKVSMIFYVVYNILCFYGKYYNHSTHHTTICWIGFICSRNMYGEVPAFLIAIFVILGWGFSYDLT